MLRLKLKVQTHKNNLQTLRLLPATQERLVMFLREHEDLLPCVQEKISISQEKKQIHRRTQSESGTRHGWWLQHHGVRHKKNLVLNISAPLRETDKEIVAEFYYRLHTKRCGINPQRRELCIWAEDVFKLHLHTWWPSLQHNTFSAAL